MPTLEGRASVKIPAGTQSGTIFRLRGKGLPELNSSRRGDLLVRTQVEVPTKLNSDQRDKLKAFADSLGGENTPESEGFFERAGVFGRLSGQAESNGVTAIWIQKDGSKACASTIDGSSHWGRVILSRTESGELDVAWGECREQPLELETAR